MRGRPCWSARRVSARRWLAACAAASRPAAGGGRFDERDGAAPGRCAAGPFPSTGDWELMSEQAFGGSPKEEASRIAEVLREGQHCVVTTRPNHAARHGIEARCRERGLSRAAYGEHICAWLADVTALVVALCPPGAPVPLWRRCSHRRRAHALGATGFQIRGRVAECVPYGQLSRRPLVAAGDDQSRRIRHRHHAVTCCEFYWRRNSSV